MKRFKNILYFAEGVTESCPALRRAMALAQSNQARLTVLDVLGEPPAIGDLAQRYDLDLGQLIRERRQDELAQLLAPLHDPATPVDTRVLHGTPFMKVIREVMRNGHDLLIKAARPPAGLSERLLGSTDLHLLRKCPCPVWIDRPGDTYPYRQILAAVDPLAEAGAGNDRLVVDLATSLAAREQAQLAVVHAWRLQQEPMLRGYRSPLPSSEVDQLVEEERHRHDQALRRLVADYALPPEQTHLVKGTPAEVIRKQAQALQADLIVMGTLGRTGVPGFFIGNTAEEVLQVTPASILAVKPASFVSPVAL